MPRREQLEISDLIADFDVVSLQRKPVSKSDVMEKLTANGQERARHIVSRIPDQRGVLNERAVDKLVNTCSLRDASVCRRNSNMGGAYWNCCCPC